MQDEQQKTQNDSQNEPADLSGAKKVSAFHNAMELQAKVRRDEELKERKRQAAAEEAAYQAKIAERRAKEEARAAKKAKKK